MASCALISPRTCGVSVFFAKVATKLRIPSRISMQRRRLQCDASWVQYVSLSRPSSAESSFPMPLIHCCHETTVPPCPYPCCIASPISPSHNTFWMCFWLASHPLMRSEDFGPSSLPRTVMTTAALGGFWTSGVDLCSVLLRLMHLFTALYSHETHPSLEKVLVRKISDTHHVQPKHSDIVIV